MSIFSSLYNQTIDYIYSTTKNRFGDVSRSIRYQNIPCRWEESNVINTSGPSLSSDKLINIWIDKEYSEVTVSDQIVHNSVEYRIRSKNLIYDLQGNLDHIHLVIG